jgi:N-hydroxyarylamine O-acetyltransferase
MLEPITLSEGVYEQRGFAFRLEKLDAHWWRLHNHQHGSAPSFDFVDEPGDPALLERLCLKLQEDRSRFVSNVILQKHTADGIAALTGRSLRVVRSDKVETRDISDVDEYERVLSTTFAMPTGDAQMLWNKISSES